MIRWQTDEDLPPLHKDAMAVLRKETHYGSMSPTSLVRWLQHSQPKLYHPRWGTNPLCRAMLLPVLADLTDDGWLLMFNRSYRVNHHRGRYLKSMGQAEAALDKLTALGIESVSVDREGCVISIGVDEINRALK